VRNVTIGESSSTTLAVGVYWCPETNTVVVQTCDMGVPLIYTMPPGWVPEDAPRVAEPPSDSGNVNVERLLAVALHSNAAEALIKGSK
jgi:hypothetical protein